MCSRALSHGVAFAAACLLAMPSPRADERLAPIVVTADTPRTGEVVLEDHVGTHAHVDGEKLRRRDIALGDVLAQEAGVQSRSTGGFGSFASITVRAASPAQTAILLDGVRLNSAGNPVVDLATLEFLTLDGIDIYRGVTPLQFGGSAIGGAVNLVTPRVADGESASSLGGGVASFGGARVEFAHRGRHGRWDSVAMLAANAGENDFPLIDDNATPLNPADDRREHRNNATVRRVGLLAKVGTAHGERAHTDLLAQIAERRLGVPDWRNDSDNDARFDTGTRQFQLTHRRDGVAAWNTAHTLFVHDQDDRFDDRDGEVGLGLQDTRTRTRSVGLDAFWSRPLGAGTFDAQAELRRETLAGRDRLGAGRDVDARRHALLLGTRWSAYALDGRLVVAPALRWRASEDRFETDDERLAERDASRGARVLSPEIGLRFDARDTLAVHASLGRHVREPSFDELFVDRGLVQGNPALVAERGINADVGLDWSNEDTLEAGVTLFASERDELISTVYDARGVGRAINTGRARIVGLELAGAWTPDDVWRLDGNATWQDAHALSDNRALDGKQLPGEARLALHAALRWHPSPRWQFRLEADALRGRYYDSANVLRARDSTIANVGVEHRRGAWRTDLSIDNLDDDVVEDFNGFPRPGRAISLHVTLTL